MAAFCDFPHNIGVGDTTDMVVVNLTTAINNGIRTANVQNEHLRFDYHHDKKRWATQ